MLKLPDNVSTASLTDRLGFEDLLKSNLDVSMCSMKSFSWGVFDKVSLCLKLFLIEFQSFPNSLLKTSFESWNIALPGRMNGSAAMGSGSACMFPPIG